MKDLAVLETMQTGRPYREMSTQLGRLGEWFDYFAAIARTEEGSTQPVRGNLLNFVRREPLGVVALISSFNHPLLISIKKLAPALAAGNSVVLKPSELAPLTVLELGKIIKASGRTSSSSLSVLERFTHSCDCSSPRWSPVDSTWPRNIDWGRSRCASSRQESRFDWRNNSWSRDWFGHRSRVEEVYCRARRKSSYYRIRYVSLETRFRRVSSCCRLTRILFAGNVDLQLAVNGVAFASFIASGQTCVVSLTDNFRSEPRSHLLPLTGRYTHHRPLFHLRLLPCRLEGEMRFDHSKDRLAILESKYDGSFNFI